MRNAVEYPRDVERSPCNPRYRRHARRILSYIDEYDLRNAHDRACNADPKNHSIENALPERTCRIRLKFRSMPLPQMNVSKMEAHALHYKPFVLRNQIRQSLLILSYLLHIHSIHIGCSICHSIVFLSESSNVRGGFQPFECNFVLSRP